MKVAILGCGPAGLFAAHAAARAGHDITILSKPRKSYMRGAQYLHRPIPGLSGDPFKIDYRLEGTVEGYKSKVYGDTSDVQVSPHTLTGIADAWDIREAYDAAWDLYGDRVVDWDATDQQQFRQLQLMHFDLVISTIPAKLLCKNDEHTFESQMVWSTDFIRYRGAFVNDDTGLVDDNIVICSGDPDDWWYRVSRIHGWENTEYPFDRKPNTDSVWAVEKPLWTDCTCHPFIHREGRYGAWKKGVLSDSAYYNIERLMKANSDDFLIESLGMEEARTVLTPEELLGHEERNQ